MHKCNVNVWEEFLELSASLLWKWWTETMQCKHTTVFHHK